MSNIVFEEHMLENSDFPFIYHFHMVGKNTGDCNWHENIEILCCTGGSGYVRCDASEHRIKKGDIAIIEPMVLHNMYADKGTMQYHCLIIDKKFCCDNTADVSKYSFPAVIHDDGISEEIAKIAALYEEKGEFYKLNIRISALKILSALCSKYAVKITAQKAKTKIQEERIREVILYIKLNYKEKLTLDDIAAHSGTSKYHLSREFKNITGNTIFQYLNIVRCKEAKQKIKDGLSVSEAAWECGYENMPYFTRTYKKITGNLPSREALKHF